ncbi:hypothetical protein SRSM4_031 [Synechococcus phage S-RSM4]|uniref:Uncharacterized protein n=1 Tax=Synechococcus phage S-RSM4 TaxID=555387 RepID=C7BUZ9_9CAUD|nr:hypothetical protein SRSM4_031 [Synechococcus phage S-RSM4]CAR63228.1 hypothetical protein SRSM4_031 [Synechococcus phage S-RSM4]
MGEYVLEDYPQPHQHRLYNKVSEDGIEYLASSTRHNFLV